MTPIQPAPSPFVLPASTPILAAKLRTLQTTDPATYAAIRTKKVEQI